MNVYDVLKLPSLKEAVVLAGQSQLARLVTTISVLEVSDPLVYGKMPVKGEYSGNELVLTSFSQVADSVDKQLAVVEQLHQHSQLGIILYYVGVIMPAVEQALIDKLEQLGMILICMPEERIDLRYSEVISEVTEYLYHEEAQIDQQQELLLTTLRSLPKPQRRMETGLSIVSDQLKCSLFIASSQQEILVSKTWPRSLDRQLRQAVSQTSFSPRQRNQLLELNQLSYFQSVFELVSPDSGTGYWLRVVRKEPLSASQLQTIYALTAAMLKYFGEEQLLNTGEQFFSACQNQDFSTAASLAAKAQVTLQQGCDLFYGEKAQTGHSLKALLTEHYEAVIFYEEAGCEWAVASPSVPINTLREASPFLSGQRYVVVAANKRNFSEVAAEITTIAQRSAGLLTAFPRKKLFGDQELQLLAEVLASDPQPYQQLLGRLEPSELEVMVTLAAYFLDQSESINDTSEQLFLHKNTIKYRLRKARKILGMDFSEIADRYFLIKLLIFYRVKFNDVNGFV